MTTKLLTALACALSCGALLHAQKTSMEAAACERMLASLELRNAKVTLAQPVTSGRFVPEAAPGAGAPPAAQTDLPAFCRVALTLTPSPDSDIKAEVWLPLGGWNGKFQQVGNGGWGGSIQYAALATALRRGYAASSTDTGHTGDTARFAMGHPEKLADFGYRAVHETAVQSKATIAAAYGSAPRLSYFVGCSGGGRQGFMEAQRFPQDFDGIVAGAPGYNRTDQSFQLVSASQATHRDAADFIPPAKLGVLHEAALMACDGSDGLRDGLISDPMRCKFDPAVTACKGADGPDCLTAAQVQAAKKIYAPVTNSHTGEVVFPGVEPGSEPRWTVNAGGPRPLGMSDDLFKYVVFKDANWDFRTLDVTKHLELARKADNGTLNATSPNIKPFVDRGGKILIYHGWGDTNVPPRSSVNYHARLTEALGAPEVERSVRLYMAPGMGHCGGGEGPNVFDALTPLEEWREKGKAPAAILASKATDDKVVRTRPLCPYPQVAQYKGSGSIDEARNFACQTPTLGIASVASAQVPVTKEPHHRVVFENRQLRILDVIIPPKDVTLDHSHDYDIVTVSMTSGTDTRVQSPGQPWSQIRPRRPLGNTGVAEYTGKPDRHLIENVGASAYHLFAVENLRQSGWSTAAPLSAAVTTLAIESRAFRAYDVRLVRERTQTSHVHTAPTIAVLISGKVLAEGSDRDAKANAPAPVGLKQLDERGQWVLIPPGETHSLVGLGTGDSHVVELEIR